MLLTFFLVASTSGASFQAQPKECTRTGEDYHLVDPMTNVEPDGENVKRGCNEQRGLRYKVSGSRTTQPKSRCSM